MYKINYIIVTTIVYSQNNQTFSITILINVHPIGIHRLKFQTQHNS